MSLWSEAVGQVEQIGSDEELSVDQQLTVALVKAVLALSDELSRIHYEGVNPSFVDLAPQG